AHSRQRSASCCANSGLNPRFTSSKLCARASAGCSGIACRGIFIRSFGDTGFFDLLAVGLIVVLLAAPPQLPHTPHRDVPWHAGNPPSTSVPSRGTWSCAAPALRNRPCDH